MVLLLYIMTFQWHSLDRYRAHLPRPGPAPSPRGTPWVHEEAAFVFLCLISIKKTSTTNGQSTGYYVEDGHMCMTGNDNIHVHLTCQCTELVNITVWNALVSMDNTY